MKRKYISIITTRASTIMIIVSICALIVTIDIAEAQTLDRSIATVRLHHTANISRNKYLQRVELLEEQTNRALTQSQKEQLLDAMINAELIMQDAENINVRVRDEEVEENIAQQRELLARQSGQSISEQQFRNLIEEQTKIQWEDYKEQVLNRLIQEKYVLRVKRQLFTSIREPTESEIEAFYEQNATQFTNPSIVHLDFLLVSTNNISEEDREARKEKASEVHRLATRSVSAFEEQKSASLDDALVIAGEVILLRDNEQQAETYGPSFIKKVFELSRNEFASAPLESNLGFHIVRVIDKRAPKVLLIDDPILPGQTITVRNQVRSRLILEQQQDALQQAVEESIADLRERAEFNTFPNRL